MNLRAAEATVSSVNDHKYPFFTVYPRPRLFGHRGAAGYLPENTIPSFERALQQGARYLELDVRMTLDGYLVVIHDPHVDRVTDKKGRVREMTLSQLRTLDAAYRFTPDGGRTFPFRGKGITIPTLEEVFKTFPDAFFNIELKQYGQPAVEALWRVIVRCGMMERVLLAAEDGMILRRIRERFGEKVATGTSRDEAYRFGLWLLKGMRPREFRLPGQAIQIPDRLLGVNYITRRLIRAAHQMGLEVHVWTVNDPLRMEELLRMGVDGIMTDFPDRFLALLRRMTIKGEPKGGEDVL